MSKLEELIVELCPDGVKYLSLSELADIGTGSSNTNEELIDGKYPFFVRSQEVRTKNEYEFDEEAIITSGDGVGVGKIFHYVNGKYALHQRAYRIHFRDNRIIPRFFLHYMKATFFQYISKSAVNSSVTSVRRPMMNKYPVPVPPLPVQREIVRILDNFTELTAELTTELTAELSARKKQYEYYRDQLLLSGDKVSKKKMGQIVKVLMCKRIKKDQTSSNGEIPFYKNGTIGKEADSFISQELFDEYSKKYQFPNTGEVMLSTAGTIGRTVRYDGKPAYFQDSNVVWLRNDETEVSNDYLYWFCMSFPWKLPSRGTIKHLHNDMILDTEISIPDPDTQCDIVERLKKFYKFCIGIESALSAEIEARQKQYEYYRDKLLTFKALS